MKTHLYIYILILISGCKSSDLINTFTDTKDTSQYLSNKAYCPKEGDCTISIHKNTIIHIKNDTAGKYYPVLEKGDYSVIEFTFLIKGPEGTADGDYSETIHFEIDKTTKRLTLKNKELEQVKLLFGKHCFCRGEAGYYKIKEGNLLLLQTNDKITIDLSFKIPEVTHKLMRVQKEIKY
ncbi:hypothetical protein [Aquimarina sp. I32.4]|uniref:hypothetical protein n=1 Tax=Aquimarina sp. I32.4 TaxID=2053903 RepID=UPI000CDEF0F7|nr:hypothetical protein [Aquimarina sp. I32.4]